MTFCTYDPTETCTACHGSSGPYVCSDHVISNGGNTAQTKEIELTKRAESANNCRPAMVFTVLKTKRYPTRLSACDDVKKEFQGGVVSTSCWTELK